MVKLYSHQEANSSHLLSVLQKYGAGLDASLTGTGKSLTALALCKKVGAKPYIITRKAIIHSWEDNCKNFGIEPAAIVNYEQLRTEKFPHGEVITKVRVVDGKEKKSHDYKWDQTLGRVVFVFDEAQACRHAKSIQSKCFTRAAERYKTLILSATPFTSPLEAYPLGYALKMFNQKTYFTWMLRHGVRKNAFGHFEFVGDRHPEKGEEYLLEIHKQLFPDRGCRTKHDEIPGFPSTQINALALETGASDEITAIYEEMIAAREEQDKENMRKDLPEELHDLVEPLAITRTMRLRQRAELLKCKAMAERAIDAADKGEFVSVYLNFDNSVSAMMKYLKTDCVVRGNGQHGVERHNNIQKFQNNKVPYIIINCAAGDAGISLHDPRTQKTRRSLISPPQSAVSLRQILGRPHRLGGGYSFQDLCFAFGTVEQVTLQNVQNKLNNLDLLCDGDLTVA